MKTNNKKSETFDAQFVVNALPNMYTRKYANLFFIHRIEITVCSIFQYFLLCSNNNEARCCKLISMQRSTLNFVQCCIWVIYFCIVHCISTSLIVLLLPCPCLNVCVFFCLLFNLRIWFSLLLDLVFIRIESIVLRFFSSRCCFFLSTRWLKTKLLAVELRFACTFFCF